MTQLLHIHQGGTSEAKCTFAEVDFQERNMKSTSSGMSGVVVVYGVSQDKELLKKGGVDAVDSLEDVLCQVQFVLQGTS